MGRRGETLESVSGSPHDTRCPHEPALAGAYVNYSLGVITVVSKP